MQPLINLNILVVLIALLSSCSESSSVHENVTENKLVFNTDTSNQYIYDFMQVVLKDQELNLTHGLSLEPELSIDRNGNDELLLNELLIEELNKDEIKTQKSETLRDTSNIKSDSVSILDLKVDLSSDADFKVSYGEKCLTKEDRLYMLAEKSRLKDFKWDNQRLGFNLANKKKWYSFSLPYFSKDRKVAIILIKELCEPFLCGNGSTLIYKLNDGVWTQEKITSWLY